MSTSVSTLLDANLSAHRARWGFVPPVDVDATRVRVETTAGPWTRVSMQTPDDRWLRVHSDRQPLDEATRALARTGATTGEPPLVCLIGAGLGYTIEVLQAHAASTTKILVLEPEPAFLRLCLERRDWTSLFETGRLMMLGGHAYDGRTEAWRLVTPEEPDPIVIRHPVITGAREAETHEALQVVARAVSGARANDEARRQFAGRYLLNTLRNLPHIVHGGDASVLAGRLAGMPAIIVGAGPSLDANMPALRAFGDRALIVSTDTAWRPLVTSGITPTIVVAADPSEINGRHLIDVPASDDTWLLSEGSVDPRALDASAGRVATFGVSDHHPWPWLRDAGFVRPRIRVWGSVLTAAFDFALTCGCDPIVFVGADLAYTDERPYCRGTTFERDWAHDTARGFSPRQIWAAVLAGRPLLTVPGVDGRDVRTTAPLIEFRNWLLARFGEHPDRRFINASGAGTLFGAGITQQTLEAALARRPARDAAIHAALRHLQREPANDARDSRTLDDMLDAAIAEAAGTGEVAPSSSLAAWLTFGRPSLTREEIHAALVNARDALRRTPSTARASTRQVAATMLERWPLRMHPADRLARLRVLLTHEDHMLDGVVADLPSAGGRTLEVVNAEIRRACDALLALPALLTTGPGLHGDSRETPLSCRFTWIEAAAPVLASLEEALVDRATLLARSTPIGPHEAAEHQADTFWTRPIRRVYDEDEDLDADVNADASELTSNRDVLFSFAPIRQWLLGNAVPETREGRSSRDQRMTEAILNALAEPHLRARQARKGDLQLHGLSASPEPCGMRIDAVMRALTGTIATPGPGSASVSRRGATIETDARGITLRVAAGARCLDDEPRYAFLAPDVSHVEPAILTEQGMPVAWSCYTHPDEDLAIVTPLGARHSLRVAPDGTWTIGPDWPIAISGEQPLGSRAGALAWNDAESTLVLRRPAGNEFVLTTVPFRPQHLAVAEDGSAFWAANGGGLWEWLPGRPGGLVCETPFCGSLFVDRDHVWLAAAIRNTRGHYVRARVKTQWRYARHDRALRQVPTGAAGCATHSATRHGWTARTYGYSDLVTIAGPGGETATLACYAPFRAAWSGGSLLISTADGAILLFRQLTEHLTARK